MARLNATTTDYGFANDWKMMTIMIGGNNLCHLCADAVANSPQTFGRLLEESIDLLYDQVPRLFINLVPPPSPVILHAYSSCTSCPTCTTAHALTAHTAHAPPHTHLIRIGGGSQMVCAGCSTTTPAHASR
jgi:hypothetical protein